MQVLNRHGVEYVLVGGLGARLHGVTNDLDLCPSWQRPNLERLAARLAPIWPWPLGRAALTLTD